MEKNFLESKTFWFNLLTLVVALAGIFGFDQYVPSPEAQETIDSIVALVVASVPVVNIVLRFATKVPLKKLW